MYVHCTVIMYIIEYTYTYLNIDGYKTYSIVDNLCYRDIVNNIVQCIAKAVYMSFKIESLILRNIIKYFQQTEHCIVYIVQCKLYSVHCRVYDVPRRSHSVISRYLFILPPRTSSF